MEWQTKCDIPFITTGTKGLNDLRFHHYVRVMHNYHKSYTLDDSNGVSPSRGYKPVNFWWWKSHTISNLIRQAMNVSMQHNVTERPFGSNGVVVCIHVHLKTWLSPDYWNFHPTGSERPPMSLLRTMIYKTFATKDLSCKQHVVRSPKCISRDHQWCFFACY